jgi:hypothetical protein
MLRFPVSCQLEPMIHTFTIIYKISVSSRKIKDLLNISLWNNLEKNIIQGKTAIPELVPQAKQSKIKTSLYNLGPFAANVTRLL